jgi:hypothetical protein
VSVGERLVHHELCFGCGRQNLFGILAELERRADGEVAGRCFIKQDHQGALERCAHEGILTAALSEAMSLACGGRARATMIEMEFAAPAPVGAFLELRARREGAGEGRLEARAWATIEGGPVASAHGVFERRD